MEEVNYLLVAGEPADIDIQKPGFWTRRDGTYDPNYSRGSIQFHPFRYFDSEVTRSLSIRKIYTEKHERWFHSVIRVIPYDSRERDVYPIMDFCGYSLGTKYINKKVSKLYLSVGSVELVSISESGSLIEIDIGVIEDDLGFTLRVFVSGKEVYSDTGADLFIGESITFRGSRRDLVQWSQIIVSDRETVGCKLSTIEITGDIEKEHPKWKGSSGNISSPEISDVSGITMVDLGDILFECNSINKEERNFVDAVILSARMNTLKETRRDISPVHHSDSATQSTEDTFDREVYLKSSQVLMRTNPTLNRRWWYSDLNNAVFGVTSKPREET